MARYCVRKQLKENDVSDEKWQNSLHCRDTWSGPRSDGLEVAQTSDDALRKPSAVVNVGQESGGGSVPTDETGEP